MRKKKFSLLFTFGLGKLQHCNYLKKSIGNIQNKKRKDKRNCIRFICKNINNQNRHINHKLQECCHHEAIYKTVEFFCCTFYQKVENENCYSKEKRKQEGQCRAEIIFGKQKCQCICNGSKYNRKYQQVDYKLIQICFIHFYFFNRSFITKYIAKATDRNDKTTVNTGNLRSRYLSS